MEVVEAGGRVGRLLFDKEVMLAVIGIIILFVLKRHAMI